MDQQAVTLHQTTPRGLFIADTEPGPLSTLFSSSITCGNSPSMMSCGRRLATFASARPRFAVRTYTSTVPRLNENPIQANDPTPRKPSPNVSATNAVPTDSFGSHDGTLQESPEVGERIRSMQAPNRATTWASNQQPREKAMVGPRFEQTIMETQV